MGEFEMRQLVVNLRRSAVGVFAMLYLTGCPGASTVTESSSLAPSAPSGLTTGTVTGSAVTISWTDNSSGETGYVVERCSGASCTNFAAVASSPLAANSTSHTETGLTASTTYRFRVAAANAFGNSDYATSSDIATTSTGGASANTCSAPTTSIIDYGQRATAGTTLAIRGSFSSMALRPTTAAVGSIPAVTSRYPGVAYSETYTAGASNLKFMYWNGSEFKVETVASGVITQYIKLVYLSSGVPLIFWGNSLTALYGASRSTADITAEGTWTVTALDTTSTAIRGVSASVNPLDEVMVVFATAASTVSGHKAIICTSNCGTVNTTNYPTSAVIDASSTAANTYSIGAGWCQTAGADYYPVAFYGVGATASRLATCRQANASTTAGCVAGGWVSGAITTSAVARVASQLYIDQTTPNATVYTATQNASGIAPVAMANCETAVNAPTWPGLTVGTVMGAATTGAIWFDMNRDAAGNFHIAANDGQTIVRTFSATTAGFTGGAWSAAPATNYVETTGAGGLPAAGAGRGSLAIDETNDQLLISYGRLAVLSPVSTWGNLVLAYNECPNGVGTCTTTTLASPAASTGMWWGNSPLDNTGQIQKTSLGWPNVSTAATSLGRPATAYVDYSVGTTAEPSTGARLKYAYRNGSTASSNWTISVIGTTSAPQSPSLAFDHNDMPWIAWSEPPTAATAAQKFYLATNTRTDGLGAWTIYSFPVTYALAAAQAYPNMSQAVVTMYQTSSGAVKRPMVIVMSSIGSVAGREIRAGLFDPTTRSWSNVKQVATFVLGGAWLSADSDSAGNVVMSFFDTGLAANTNCASATNRCIRFGYTTDGGATWSNTTTGLVTTTVNTETLVPKVAINPSNNRPAIAYMDRSNNLVRYKYCSTTLASCTTAANWLDLGVGILDAGTGTSGLTDAANAGQLDVGLTFTSDGLPWVTYPRGAGATQAPSLMYSYVASSGGVFGGSANLYASPGVGNISSPVAATANNFATSWNPNSVRSSYTGSLHTAFVGPGNFLYMTSCGD